MALSVVTMLPAVAVAQTADDQPLLKRLDEGPLGLFDGDDSVELSIPIVVRDGVEELRTEVVVVALDGVQRPDLRPAFDAVVEGLPGTTPRLALAVDTTLTLPGTYGVELAIAGPDRDEAPSRVPIEVVQAPATLRQPATLRVERVRGLPWASRLESETATTLTLRETSRRSRLTDVVVEPAGPALADGAPVTGRIEAGTVPTVAPGGVAVVDYDTAGAFPIGRSEGELLIDARQIDAALTIPYVVQTKVHWAWIGIIAFVGLLFSFVLKIYLAGRIERLEAQDKAYVLQETIARDLQRIKDPNYQDALTKIRGDVAAALTDRKAKELADEVTKGRTALEAARTKLDEAIDKATTEIDTLSPITDVSADDLPPAAAAINHARTAVAKARVELDKQTNPTAARSTVKEAAGKIERLLKGEYADWRAGADAVATALRQTTPPLPATPVSTLLTAAADAIARAAAVDLDELARAVDAGADAYPVVGRIIKLLPQLESYARDIANALGSDGSAITLDADSLKDRIVEYEGAPSTANGVALATAISLLLGGMRDTIEDVAKRAGADLADVNEHLQAGRYERAAQRARPGSSAGLVQPRRTAADRAVDLAEATFAALVGTASGAQERRDVVSVGVLPELPVAPRMRTIRNRGALAKAYAWRWLAIALLLVLSSYALFLDDFVGSFADLVKVFSWAFAVDVTLDAVQGALRPAPAA